MSHQKWKYDTKFWFPWPKIINKKRLNAIFNAQTQIRKVTKPHHIYDVWPRRLKETRKKTRIKNPTKEKSHCHAWQEWYFKIKIKWSFMKLLRIYEKNLNKKKKKKRKCEERYRDAAGWECPDNNDNNVYDRWEKSSHKNEEPCTIFFFFFEIKGKTLYYLWNFKNLIFFPPFLYDDKLMNDKCIWFPSWLLSKIKLCLPFLSSFAFISGVPSYTDSSLPYRLAIGNFLIKKTIFLCLILV